MSVISPTITVPRPIADVSDDLVPNHVAIIMDGNGRWAAARRLPKIAGHREGARAVRRTIEAAIQQGVGWLTLYAFSSENWRRPAGEVIDLTGLLRQYLKSELAELKTNGVRLRIYGARSEIAAAARRLAEAVRAGRLDPTDIDEACFATALATHGIPDPDLLI